MATKKIWRKRAKEAMRQCQIEAEKCTFAINILEVLMRSRDISTLQNGANTVQEGDLERVLVNKTNFSKMKMVNGFDVSNVIKSHPEWSDTEVAKYLGGGISRQFVTAWKVYHDDWKSR